jgi:hypothetical protein
MVEKASRRGAVDMGVVLMVITFALFGYFLYWLQQQAAIERASAAVVEETPDAVTDDPFASATSVMAGDLVTGAGAGAYVGQVVRVSATEVASALGRQGFWLDVEQSPFLVSYSTELLADSVTVSPGSTVTVTGTVIAMNDSIAGSWLEAGRIGEGDQLAASFATHFIEAQRIQTGPGGGGN